jgi:hypothetical protein
VHCYKKQKRLFLHPRFCSLIYRSRQLADIKFMSAKSQHHFEAVFNRAEFRPGFFAAKKLKIILTLAAFQRQSRTEIIVLFTN